MVGAVTAMLSGFDSVAGQVPNTAPGVVIPIFFGEPWMADEATQDALAWPTNLWSSMQVQVDLGAASTPTLAAFAVVDDLTVTKEPSIVKYIRGSIPASGTSFDFTLSERRDLLRAIHIYQDSGGSNTPSEVDLRKDGKILHELSYAANQGLLVGYQMTPNASGRTAGIYDLVLDHDGLLVSAVDLSQGTAPTVTVKAASTMSGTTTYILERLGPRE